MQEPVARNIEQPLVFRVHCYQVIHGSNAGDVIILVDINNPFSEQALARRDTTG